MPLSVLLRRCTTSLHILWRTVYSVKCLAVTHAAWLSCSDHCYRSAVHWHQSMACHNPVSLCIALYRSVCLSVSTWCRVKCHRDLHVTFVWCSYSKLIACRKFGHMIKERSAWYWLLAQASTPPWMPGRYCRISAWRMSSSVFMGNIWRCPRY